MAKDGAAAGDPISTFPKLLAGHARTRPGRPALREKDLGIWQTWTWAHLAAEVERVAAGLKDLGLRRGEGREHQERRYNRCLFYRVRHIIIIISRLGAQANSPYAGGIKGA